MNQYRTLFLSLFILLSHTLTATENQGRISWLPYGKDDKATVTVTQEHLSPTLSIACRELRDNWNGQPVRLTKKGIAKKLPRNGYAISRTDDEVIIQGSDDLGILYGAYALLRNPQSGKDSCLYDSPAYDLRILNHWDNLDGTIERGYAGHSLWKWDELPTTVSPRYEEYARANAAIGINGTVLNNVNASPRILSHDYLVKVARL
ncbi:MAG: alpha-glucuronidase, partial [Duncaniella sp.]|nr:alpha-glucuronidase [Duncaniella sp.]